MCVHVHFCVYILSHNRKCMSSHEFQSQKYKNIWPRVLPSAFPIIVLIPSCLNYPEGWFFFIGRTSVQLPTRLQKGTQIFFLFSVLSCRERYMAFISTNGFLPCFFFPSGKFNTLIRTIWKYKDRMYVWGLLTFSGCTHVLVTTRRNLHFNSPNKLLEY